MFRLNLRALKSGEEQPSAQEIVCEPPLPADVSAVLVNELATYIVVTSGTEAIVIELPQHGIQRDLGLRAKTLKCRTCPIGDYFHHSNPALTIIQVAWHPLTNVHLVVLTSDNQLRLYNMLKNKGDLEQEFDLSTNKTSFCGFTFGPLIDWEAFCIYLLAIDGSISCLCPIVPNGCQYNRKKLLKLFPAANSHSLVPSSSPTSKPQTHARRRQEAALELQRDICTNWLRERWIGVLDEKEIRCLSTNLSLSQLWDAPMPILQGPLHARAPANATASALVSMPPPQLPTRLVRCFVEGQVDILLGFDGIQPLFQSENYGRVPRIPVDDQPLLKSVFLGDRVDVGTSQLSPNSPDISSFAQRPRLYVDPHDCCVVFVQTSHLHMIHMPWQSDLLETVAKAEKNDLGRQNIPRACSEIMANMTSDCIRISRGPLKQLVGSDILTNRTFGRYSICVTSSPSSTDKEAKPGYTCIVEAIPQHRFPQIVHAANRQALAIQESKTNNIRHSFNEMGIIPFAEEIAGFLTTYKNFKMAALKEIKELPPQARWDSPEALDAFFRIQAKFNEIFADLQQIQRQICQRIGLLTSVADKQEQIFNRLETDVRELIVRNELIKENVKAHTQLTKIFREQFNVFLQLQLSQTPLSAAEKKFQENLLQKEKDLGRYGNKLLSLRAKARAVKQFRKARGDQNGQISNGGRAALRGPQAEQLQAVVDEHNKELAQQIQHINTLRRSFDRLQVRTSIPSVMAARSPEAE